MPIGIGNILGVTAVLFVHGTGVRRASFDVTYKLFVSQLATRRPDLVVSPCYWGDSCGSRLNMDGASVPAGDSPRGLAGSVANFVASDDELMALWSVLLIDPLFELRLIRSSQSAVREMPPTAEPAGRQTYLRCRALAECAAVASSAEAMSLGDVLPDAVNSVLDSETGKDALRHELSLGSSLYLPLARAFVASAILLGDVSIDGSLPIDGGHRDELVGHIVVELGGSDRGFASTIANVALSMGATKPIERRRAAITSAASPAAGDVMLYLARGDSLRRFIRSTAQKITANAESAVIVGHSLGGIASFETLASERIPGVEGLITVGSQVSYLYELNALPVLEYPSPLPMSVPSWVNVFDPRDLLSFSAGAIFKDRVKDIRIDNKQPFPRSHSAYFGNNRFYDLLSEVIPR